MASLTSDALTTEVYIHLLFTRILFHLKSLVFFFVVGGGGGGGINYRQ